MPALHNSPFSPPEFCDKEVVIYMRNFESLTAQFFILSNFEYCGHYCPIVSAPDDR
jgi:hypothetical protein